MKNGVCPKCGSSNIYRCERPKMANSSSVLDAEQISAFRSAWSTRYVCLDCGFTERYFEDEELERIRDKAKRG